MSQYASIEDRNGVPTIVGRYTGAQAFDTAEVPDEAREGWVLINGEWQEPPVSDAEQIRLALLALFSTFAPGVQAFFQPEAVAMREAFAAGDIALAKQILETAPVPAELIASRDQLIALFPTP